MKKFFSSPWFRIILCAVLTIPFIVIPYIVVSTTRSNGLGAGVFVLTLFCGLPFSSLLCGCFAAPDARKLWILPALPQILYFLLFSFLTDAHLYFRLAQFSGLFFGYAAFAICADLLRRKKNKTETSNTNIPPKED